MFIRKMWDLRATEVLSVSIVNLLKHTGQNFGIFSVLVYLLTKFGEKISAVKLQMALLQISFHKISARSDMGPRTFIMAEGHNFNYLFVLLSRKMSDVEIE